MNTHNLGDLVQASKLFWEHMDISDQNFVMIVIKTCPPDRYFVQLVSPMTEEYKRIPPPRNFWWGAYLESLSNNNKDKFKHLVNLSPEIRLKTVQSSHI